ncbi:unnamed protein product [Jaminaea pallidilutea]
MSEVHERGQSVAVTSHPLEPDIDAAQQASGSSVAPAQPFSSDSPTVAQQEETAPANDPRSNDNNGNDGNDDGGDAAARVRENLLLSMWHGYLDQRWWRRWSIVAALLLQIAQVVPAIVVLSLPTSLGDSRPAQGTTGECDPEPIFVFLALHTVRVVCNAPLDLYIELSPHSSAAMRRPGSHGFAERERRRRLGSLALDRKLARLVDLLSLVHIILFVVGNYAVWTRTECAAEPADSVPLFWMSLSVLVITYAVVGAAILAIVLVVFFLPATFGIVRALGLGDRLPGNTIKPETAKIEQNAIEKVTKLVYYVAEPEEERPPVPTATAPVAVAATDLVRASLEDSRLQATAMEVAKESNAADTAGTEDNRRDVNHEATQVPMPLSTAPTPTSASRASLSQRTTAANIAEAIDQRPPRWRIAMKRVLPHRRRQKANDADANAQPTDAQGKKLKYPLYPLPSHRSTCPICLVDYETPGSSSSEGLNDGGATDTQGGQDGDKPSSEKQDEDQLVLRVLPCNHVLHRHCVDEWLTTVSGRCPVCQRPVLGEEESSDGQPQQGSGRPGNGSGSDGDAHVANNVA